VLGCSHRNGLIHGAGHSGYGSLATHTREFRDEEAARVGLEPRDRVVSSKSS
jgi:hypothetical protein